MPNTSIPVHHFNYEANDVPGELDDWLLGFIFEMHPCNTFTDLDYTDDDFLVGSSIQVAQRPLNRKTTEMVRYQMA